MGVITFDSKKITNDVIPYLNNAKNALKTAYTNSTLLNKYLPSDFLYKKYASGLSSQINELKIEIISYNDKMNDAVTSANKIEERNSSKAASILSLASKLDVGYTHDYTKKTGATTSKSSKVFSDIKTKLEQTKAKIAKQFTSKVVKISTKISKLKTKITSKFKSRVNNIKVLTKKSFVGIKSVYEKVSPIVYDFLKTTGATIVVGFTTILSGCLKIVENIVIDGVGWVISKVVSLFSKESEKTIKEFIGRDLIQELNDSLYGKTNIGQKINEFSALKYNSDTSKKIQNISMIVGEFALATAATVATGGATSFLLPAVLGSLFGLGSTAESTYQQKGVQTSFRDEAMIAFSGVLTGLSWAANGKLGKGFVNIASSAVKDGIKNTFSTIGKEVFNKVFIKETLKEGLASKSAIGNYLGSFAMLGEDFSKILIGEEELNTKTVAKLSGKFLLALGANVIEDGFRSYVSGDYISGFINEIKNPDSKINLNNYMDLEDTSLKKLLSGLSDDELIKQASILDSNNFEKLIYTMDNKSSNLLISELSDYSIVNLNKSDPTLFDRLINNKKIESSFKMRLNDASVEIEKIDENIKNLKYNKMNPVKYSFEYLKSNFRKYIYKDTNEFDGLNDDIVKNGLYHFTDNADIILDSGYIKSSSYNTSYGNKKTFLFNGIPSVSDFAINLDSVPIKTTAVKLNPDLDFVNSRSLKIRAFDDLAISYDGNLNLNNLNPQKTFFCLDFDDAGSLVYKQVSEEYYNNFDKSSTASILKKYLSEKGNIDAIKSNYFAEINLRNTNANLLNSNPVSIMLTKNNSELSMNPNYINRLKTLRQQGLSLAEEELAFFNGGSLLNKNKYKAMSDVDLNITSAQKQTINEINNYIRHGKNCIVTYNSTSEISSAMLDQIDDLSKVQIKLLDGLGDSEGSLKSKYLGKAKYDARVTYNGYEMKLILQRIENLQSKIDINLPVEQRAKQIYDILSAEVPVMHDFESYEYGHHVSASLRGLIPENLVGKDGLVCAGYASAYKELCERVGIKCDYVRGIVPADPLRNFSGGGHAWNVVYTNDGIIPVDVTWRACSGGTKDWFGGSYEFVQTHIADADEISKNYSGMIPSIMFESSSNKLNNVLSTLDSKYGNRDESIRRLRQCVETGDFTKITRDNNARKIISTVDEQTLRNFVYELDVNNKISSAIYTLDKKYGSGYGINALKKYLETGNSNFITRTNGTRNLICSLNSKDIERYLQEFGG